MKINGARPVVVKEPVDILDTYADRYWGIYVGPRESQPARHPDRKLERSRSALRRSSAKTSENYDFSKLSLWLFRYYISWFFKFNGFFQ